MSVINTMDVESYVSRRDGECTTRVLSETNAASRIEQRSSTSSQVNSDRNQHIKKKIRDPKNWKVNILKKKSLNGESHINNKGRYIPARFVNHLKDCINSCKFNCSRKISDSERLNLFTSFYKLDHYGKKLFILNNTERYSTERPKKTQNIPYKKFSFKYHFNLCNNQIQVCKKFFLGTLSISQKPIYNAHNGKDTTNTPKPDNRGKNSNKRINSSTLDAVKSHINSFPRIESHYCRRTTNKQFLDSQLSLRKMYSLYCDDPNNHASPVKLSMYRYIFNTHFNLSFHTRKSDRCDLCEEYIVATKNNMTQDLDIRYQEHIVKKDFMRAERKKDRENKNVPVLCFDLQNVIALPRADISSFFYKRKLNVYNLTAHFSLTKTIYCAIWTECASGRGGNELASALKKILDKVVEENNITQLVTWSDSCVPQNRNSFISTAVLQFLSENPQITDFQMKYSVPGHSCVQEVDSAHSQIEKSLSNTEIYSPLGLVRLLKSINERKPLRVLLMTENDFRDYGTVAKTLNFKDVPFTSICALRFTGNLSEIKFLKSFQNSIYSQVNLRLHNRPKRKVSGIETTFNNPGLYKNPGVISKEKKNDIKKMLKFMSLQDQLYYKTTLNI